MEKQGEGCKEHPNQFSKRFQLDFTERKNFIDGKLKHDSPKGEYMTFQSLLPFSIFFFFFF